MRRMGWAATAAMAVAISAAGTTAIMPRGAARPLLTWADLTARPRPTGAMRIPYGPDPLQYADLWKPAGQGPFPVVLMIHGGCWQTDIADASLMDWAAADLRGRGIAVWNIDYRGIDRPGGGWPGTFQDVAAAADLLAAKGAGLGLRTDRIVAVGHSAGGHLALWLAGRPSLPAGSILHSAYPAKLAAAISLGGLPDLEVARVPPGDTCGGDTVARLIGAPDATRPDPYVETSPARLPTGVPLTLINAVRDRIAPPAFATAYAAKVRVDRVTVPDEGHAELIAPGSRAWRAAIRRIEAALRR